MPSRIKVYLNQPRTELLAEGWRMNRTAAAMRPGQRVPGLVPGSSEWRISNLPTELWQEPGTGVIMCKPHTLEAALLADPAFSGAHIGLSDLHASSMIQAIQTSPVTGIKMLGRMSTNASMIEVAVLRAFDSLNTDAGLGHAARTKEPLLPNEGFCLVAQWGGTQSSRAKALFGISFGKRFFVEGSATGFLKVHYNYGTDAVPDWRLIKRAPFRAGNVGHLDALHVMVLPWGQANLSIYVSVGSIGNIQTITNHGAGGKNIDSVTVDLADHGIEYPWIEAYQANQKTAAGPLDICLPKVNTSVTFSVMKLRYKTGTFTMVPEPMDDLQPSTPTIEPAGYFDFTGAHASAPKVTAQALGPDGVAAFDHTTDREAALKFTLTPGPGGVHTPELWWVNAEVPPTTWMPDYTRVDVSDQWSKIRLQKTNRMEGASASIVLEQQPYETLLHRGGPVQVEITPAAGGDPVIVYEGYVHERGTVLHGANAIAHTEHQCDDMFQARFNERKVGREVSLEDHSLGWLLKRLFKRSGSLDSEIEIEDRLYDMSLATFLEANSLTTITMDAYFGDVLRDLGGYFSLQGTGGLRIQRVAGKWKAYLAARWKTGDALPRTVFLLDDGQLDTWDGTGRNRTDFQRWSGAGYRFLKVTGDPEFSIKLPKFNALRLTSQDSGAQGATATLAMIGPHPDVLNDPTSERFEGRIRWEDISAPQALPSDDIEAYRYARTIYDLEQQQGKALSLRAEWQEWVNPDDFALVIGHDDQGRSCSYGVWQIGSVDAEMSHDRDLSGHEWSGSYTLEFQDRTDISAFPMFDVVGA